jgi:hypothetical protein
MRTFSRQLILSSQHPPVKAAQNPAQQAAAPSSTEQQETKQAAAKQRLMPRNATSCTIVQPAKVELDGLERCHQTSGKSNILPQGGTVCGTVDAQNPPLDPQLQLLIERWPCLAYSSRLPAWQCDPAWCGI